MNALASIFISSFFIAFSGAMMPGPLLSATIEKSAKHGMAAGPLFILGHGILELVLLGFLFLGIAPLLQSNMFFTIVSVAGGVIMVWMAVLMLKGLPDLSLYAERQFKDYGSLILTGAVLSLSNPYWSVWWATIGLGFILTAAKTGPAGIASFFAGHILADLAWYTFVSALIWKGKKLLNDTAYRIIIGICAVILLAFGIFFLIKGIAINEI